VYVCVCLNQLFFFIEMKTKIGSLHSAIKIHTYGKDLNLIYLLKSFVYMLRKMENNANKQIFVYLFKFYYSNEKLNLFSYGRFTLLKVYCLKKWQNK